MTEAAWSTWCIIIDIIIYIIDQPICCLIDYQWLIHWTNQGSELDVCGTSWPTALTYIIIYMVMKCMGSTLGTRELWVMGEYWLSGLWVRRESTVVRKNNKKSDSYLSCILVFAFRCGPCGTLLFTPGSGLFIAVKIGAKLINHCLNFWMLYPPDK